MSNKKFLPGNSSIKANFLVLAIFFNTASACKTKHNSIRSKALPKAL